MESAAKARMTDQSQFAFRTLWALSQRSPIGLWVTNELINRFDPDATPEAIHDRDNRLLRELMHHPDPYTGLNGFLDKVITRPDWQNAHAEPQC